MAKCKKCGAEIVFISMPSGKVMPCNDEIIEGMKDPMGKDVLVSKNGEVVRCSLKPSPILSIPVYGRRPHWATCPYANDFRKRGDS